MNEELEQELELLEATYFDVYEKLSDEPVSIAIDVVPSDEDFPFALDKVRVEVTFPAAYPEEVPNFIIPDQEGLPPNLRQKIEKALAAEGENYLGAPMVQALVYWLDSELESLLVDTDMTKEFEDSHALAANDDDAPAKSYLADVDLNDEYAVRSAEIAYKMRTLDHNADNVIDQLNELYAAQKELDDTFKHVKD